MSDDHVQQECFLYYLKPGAGPEYDRLHAQALPEIRDRLSRHGVFDYSIFRRGDLVISVLRHRRSSAFDDPSLDRHQEAWSGTLRRLFACIADVDGNRLTAHRVFRLD
jgi:L-rhamnose mutarotase